MKTLLMRVVESVGERAGAVTIRVYLMNEREAWFCSPSLTEGFVNVRDLVQRELDKDSPETKKEGA